MRISSNMTFDNFIFNQQRLSAQLLADQLRLASGRAVNRPSDAPVQASRLLNLSEIQESQGQILENIRFASDLVNAADASLSEVADLLIRVQQLASGAVNSLALPEEREAAADEIRSIKDAIFRIANSTHLGLYIFGGQDLLTAPVVDELGGLHYVGDTGKLSARIAIEGDDEYSLTAHEVFTMLSARVKGNVDLNPAVTLQTRLDELQGANALGIRPGSLRFEEEGVAGSYTVDLTAATSLGQIIDLINQAAADAGSTLTAAINAAGDGLVITPGDAVRISGFDNGVVASDLGVVTDVATTDPIVGADLNRLLTRTTPIADLFAGTGIDFTGNTFRIRNGDLSAAIDLTFAETLQDIINAIHNAGLGVRASINDSGDGLDVLNEVSGTVMSIEEEGGTAAALLGIRTLSLSTPLADLNFGNGVGRIEGEEDLTITDKAGNAVSINLDTAATVQDVLDLINTAATDAGVAVEASLSAVGNGIRLVDTSGGAGALQIIRPDNLSTAVTDLGLDVTIDAAATEVTGNDVSDVRVDGLFTALLDLTAALLGEEERDITEAAQRVASKLIEITRVQGQIGAEARALQQRADRTQNAVDATTVLLSQLRDVDFAEAITRFQQTQTALQASLLASGQIQNLSLLNFLS